MFSLTFRTSTVCSLSANTGDQLLSTMRLIERIGWLPTSASAAAQVELTDPPDLRGVDRTASAVPTRLPLESHVSFAQPVKLGDGPR